MPRGSLTTWRIQPPATSGSFEKVGFMVRNVENIMLNFFGSRA